MTFTRIAVRVGIVFIIAFMLLVAIGIHGAFTPVIVVVALGGLIACGNLLYGKNSHGAMAKARVRPAQEAQNRAIDEAQQRARQEREQLRRQRLEARWQRYHGGPERQQSDLGSPQQSGDDPR
jgi:type VI protein secretion system component VasK